MTSEVFRHTYETDKPRRGKCVLFVNQSFEGFGVKPKSDVYADAVRIAKCFQKLDFDIILCIGFSEKDIDNKLESIKREGFERDDYFVCSFVTHGDTDFMFSKEGVIRKENVIQMFLGDACPSLIGKPKIFIISCCESCKAEKQQKDIPDKNGKKTSLKLPTHADFFVYPSSLPCDSTVTFGKVFGDTLLQHGRQYDLVTMATLVNNKMISISDDPIKVPSFISTLTKQIYFPDKQRKRPKNHLAK